MKAKIIILICIAALALATIACIIGGDPTPGGWQPTQGSPGDNLAATLTPAKAEFDAWLTAVAETDEP